MSPRRTVAAVVALVATTGVLGGCSDADSPKAGGPMRGYPVHGYAITVAPGHTFTDGLESLVIRGDKPATLNSVELVGAEGMEILGYKLVGPERKVNGQWWPGYPPKGRQLQQALVVPSTSAIRPHEPGGWELLLGIKVTKPGPLWRDGLRYTYTVDGVRYTKTVPAQLKVCTSTAQEVDGSCPPPKGY
jgi:hypothetical protein